MTEKTPAGTPRSQFLRAAQEELAEFERHEDNFRKKELKERASQLAIALQSKTLLNKD